VNPYLAVFGDRRYLGLTSLLTFGELAIATAVASRLTPAMPWLAASIVGSAVITDAYAFVQRLGLDPIHWIADPRPRPFSTLGNPDFYGQYLAVILLATLAALAFVPRIRRGWVALGPASFAAVTAALVIIVATRGALIGVGAGGVVLSALWLRREGIRRWTVAVVAGATLLAGVALALVLAVTPLGTRVAALVEGRFGDRVLLYGSSFAIARDHPILGVGHENLSVVYAAYRQPEVSDVFGKTFAQTNAHNFVLHTAATTGLLGLAALLVLLVLFATTVWRAAREPDGAAVAIAGVALAAYYGSALVLPDAQSIDWMPWTCIGIALAWDAQHRSSLWSLRRMAVPPFLGVVIVLLALVPAALAWTPVRSSEAALVALSAARAASASGVSSGVLATTLDPDRADRWFALGAAREAAHDRTGAIAAFTEATRRRPDLVRNWWAISRVNIDLAAAGDGAAGAAAETAARRGIAADPLDPDGWDQLGRVQLLALADPTAALTTERHAIQLYPRERQYYLVAAEALRRLNDLPGAVAMLRDGVAATGSNDIKVNLARALAATGQRDEARTLVLQVLKADPGNSDAQALATELAAP
jgi:O-antigen ligase/cytochrome c-type biogenesis protein CcmH/NrfG